VIALCTGDPDVKREGDQFEVEFPSGDGFVRVAISRHQLFRLAHRSQVVSYVANHGDQVRQSAEVMSLKRRRRWA
jgi:hypothetical protein